MFKNVFISTLVSILFNTAIAGLLTVISFEESFWINFVFSQCIGLSIYAVNSTVICHISDKRWRLATLVFTFPGSIMFGVTLAAWLTGAGDWSDPKAWVAVVIGLFFGGIGSITYFLSQRVEQLDAEVKQRRMNEMESEKRQMEAQLKMLQAQIEPHFLFNTLANASSLIDSDPALAKKLLERLNDWLRIALVRARSDSATLGDELEMLENYLQILKIRFGERLHWFTDVEGEARNMSFPPMLLQPLVENAVRHGIEPKIGGGEIIIRATLVEEVLRIEVSDTGVGLLNNDGAGTGLANVRARLATLFGERGRLTLEGNVNGGVTAMLELPR
ncbi:MAG: histidine kinase [Sideroxydans sp.]